MYVAKSISDLDDLATRMLALEEEAYNQFAHIFGPRLRAFFVRRGLSDSDAEDLAGSCITDIALKVRHYRHVTGGGFKAWVFTLARHALVDWLRTRLPTQELPDDLPSEAANETTEEDLSVVLAVQDALAKLSDLDRSLILLRNLKEEDTYLAFLSENKISAGTARVRHFRALKKLKQILLQDPRITTYLKDKDLSE